jgi:hypothetical protein
LSAASWSTVVVDLAIDVAGAVVLACRGRASELDEPQPAATSATIAATARPPAADRQRDGSGG